MLARNTDPVSSHEAADDLQKSGKHVLQKNTVLKALKDYESQYGQMATSAELAARFKLDRHMVGKRLPDLEKEWKVIRRGMKRCSVGGKKATAWGSM